MTSKLSSNVGGNIKNLGHNVLRGADVFDCEQLYCLLGLLILEGRIPEKSDAGRCPGPHAHFAFNNSAFKNHMCDFTSKCCLIAQQYREKLGDLARKSLSMSIEVWLLPQCGHYALSHNNTSSEESYCQGDYYCTNLLQLDCPIQEGFVLIEEWTITVTPKRIFSGPIQTVTSLLQTISSYLHSSKLGSVLSETKGSFPTNIYYKISQNQPTTSLLSTSYSQPPSCHGNNTNYRQLSFPSISSGHSNILNLHLHTLPDILWPTSIPCIICTTNNPMTSSSCHDDSSPPMMTSLPISSSVSSSTSSKMMTSSPISSSVTSSSTSSKMMTSSSSLSFSTLSSRREKTLSESQDKRRGFTLPLHNPTRNRIRKQQIISPMVVCTDQSEPPPFTTLTSGFCRRNTSSVVKDLTPYQPRFDTLQDISQSFLGYQCLDNNIEDVSMDTNMSNLEELSNNFLRNTLVASNNSNGDSSSSQTPVLNKPPPRRKSENRIIFTDSSSCESIDKYSSGCVLPAPPVTQSNLDESKMPSNIGSPIIFDLYPGDNNNSITNKVVEDVNIHEMFQKQNPYKKHGSNQLLFHKKTGLPLQSSPAPAKRTSSDKSQRKTSSKLDACSGIAIKHNRSAVAMTQHRLAITPGVEICSSSTSSTSDHPASSPTAEYGGTISGTNRNLSSSAPVVSSQKLLVNFEESMLNMRIHPVGMIPGFEVEIGASGSFNPKHVRLPLTTYFFQLSDDNAPSPYLGFVDLHTLPNRRGYQIPKKGSIQLTLFNPNGAVIKMFVVLYNLSDMPPNHQTFLRQRTVYLPVHASNNMLTTNHPHHHHYSNQSSLVTNGGGSNSVHNNNNNWTSQQHNYPRDESLEHLPSYLRYLVHLKIHSSKSGKLFLHTDIRLIFSRDKFEFDPSVATYELRSFVDPPPEPRYSPKN